MSTIVETTVPSSEFALATTFSAEPAVTFRTVGLVAGGATNVMPFLWADHDDTDRLTAVIDRDDSVTDIEQVASVNGGCLLRLDWGDRTCEFVSTIIDRDASIIEASGYNGTWHLQLFVPDHDGSAPSPEMFDDTNIDISVSDTTPLSTPGAAGPLGLTERQYETVVTAYEAGYYDIPRKVSLAELAAEFDVSHQALSERLRRAHRTVITTALYHKVYPRESAVSARCTAKAIANRTP